MGLPMRISSPKAGPSNEEASNKPPVDNPVTTPPPPPPPPPDLGSLLISLEPHPPNSAEAQQPVSAVLLAGNGDRGDTSEASSSGSASSAGSATSATSATSQNSWESSADDVTLRLERLHSLRNRLVDRMHRREINEALLHRNHANINPENNNNGEGPSGSRRTSGSAFGTAGDTRTTTTTSTSTGRPIPVVAPSRPIAIPIPTGTQVRSGGSRNLNGPDAAEDWPMGRLLPGESSEAQGNTRGHSRRIEETRRIMETARRASADRQASDRQAVNGRGEGLISIREFLRESWEPVRPREPTTNNGDPLPASGNSQRNRRMSLPPINDRDPSRIDRWDLTRVEEPGDGSLNTVRLDDPLSSTITVPATLPAFAWWPLEAPPPGHHMASNETFDTFINHIRRIGHLQDAMLATISARNSTLAQASRAAAGSSGTNPITSPGDGASSSTAPSTGTSTARPGAVTTATSGAAASTDTESPPLNPAEARLRAMQTRIDILTSEFSLLRSSWAVSHSENQGYERSLRRLQEYLPSARRAERVRRGNRGGEVSLHYEDLHTDARHNLPEGFSRSWLETEAEMMNREQARIPAARALGREGLAGAGSTMGTQNGNGEAQTSNVEPTVPAVPAEASTRLFSLAEREILLRLLAARMDEVTLRGMR